MIPFEKHKKGYKKLLEITSAEEYSNEEIYRLLKQLGFPLPSKDKAGIRAVINQYDRKDLMLLLKVIMRFRCQEGVNKAELLLKHGVDPDKTSVDIMYLSPNS